MVSFHRFIFADQNRGVAQLASVLVWGTRGRPFESDHPDNKVESSKNEFVF